MEFIRTLSEKQHISRQNDISDQAHSLICLDDFEGRIFITYNGTPLIPLDEKLTQKEILAKLEEMRNSYINYKMKMLNKQSSVAFF